MNGAEVTPSRVTHTETAIESFTHFELCHADAGLALGFATRVWRNKCEFGKHENASIVFGRLAHCVESVAWRYARADVLLHFMAV